MVETSSASEAKRSTAAAGVTAPSGPFRERVVFMRRDVRGRPGRAPALRLRLLSEHAGAISELEHHGEEICCDMAKLVKQTGTQLDQLCGISTRSAAELPVEVGDPCRFTDGGFASFNGTAPLPASSAEGDDEPV